MCVALAWPVQLHHVYICILLNLLAYYYLTLLAKLTAYVNYFYEPIANPRKIVGLKTLPSFIQF